MGSSDHACGLKHLAGVSDSWTLPICHGSDYDGTHDGTKDEHTDLQMARRSGMSKGGRTLPNRIAHVVYVERGLLSLNDAASSAPCRAGGELDQGEEVGMRSLVFPSGKFLQYWQYMMFD